MKLAFPLALVIFSMAVTARSAEPPGPALGPVPTAAGAKVGTPELVATWETPREKIKAAKK